MIEPAAPIFSAHGRLIFTEGAQNADLLFGLGAEVGHAQVLVERAADKHGIAGAVRRKVQAIHAVFFIDLCDGAQVIFVISVRAVFIFHLQHNDVSAVGDQAGTDKREQLFIVAAHFGKKNLVVAAQGHFVVGKNPCGQTAKFPFGADVRAGTENHIQSDFPCRVDVAGNVEIAGKIKFALSRFMQVP